MAEYANAAVSARRSSITYSNVYIDEIDILSVEGEGEYNYEMGEKFEIILRTL